MALDKFKAAPLPNPPAQYDAQYIRQVVRVLETYFSQLDSRAANNASKYTADAFVGGSFTGTDITASGTVDTDLLIAHNSLIGYERANGVWTDALISYGHRNGSQITDHLMAQDVYADFFYGDGRYIQTPYNQFTSSATQTAPDVATANELTYTDTDFPDGIILQNSSEIKLSRTGVYNFTYSLQFKNTDNSTHDIDIWFRRNGTDLASSNSRFSIPARKTAGTPSHLIAVTSYMIDIEADNDYVEVIWRVSSTTVSLETFAAVTASPGVTPAIPATPSVILSVTFISAQFPQKTRVAPLPVFGFGEIGAISVVTR